MRRRRRCRHLAQSWQVSRAHRAGWGNCAAPFLRHREDSHFSGHLVALAIHCVSVQVVSFASLHSQHSLGARLNTALEMLINLPLAQTRSRPMCDPFCIVGVVIQVGKNVDRTLTLLSLDRSNCGLYVLCF